MCTTGNGATITFATTGIILRLIDIGELVEEVADIEDNDLSLGGFDHAQYCPGRIIDHSPVDLNVAVDPDVLPALGTEELVTITYPVPTGMSAGATRSGTGWLMRRSGGTLASNQRAEGSYAVRFQGGAAGIGHTAAS